MPDDLIVAQAGVFLHAGFDTTATALGFLTYELAFHPEIQVGAYIYNLRTIVNLFLSILSVYCLLVVLINK